ncbi:unnamed protein product [Rotaria sp. Silwood1]|nr:unnamed protein product [Rotaria sp. Silwood1]
MSHEDRLIRKLKQLKNNGFITEKEYNFCRPTGSQPARIYGLPKIHKIGAPLRPIVSASGTFNCNLAKLLANKLDHLRKNGTIITNTFAFVDELLALEFDNSQIKMVSLDITSLFTNVPLQHTIQIFLDKLYGPEHTCTYSDKKRDDWYQKCKNRFEMKYLLDTSTQDTNFIFNNKIYSQINGVAMGSPLGPVSNNKLSNNSIKNFINNLNNKAADNLTISSNNKSLNSSTVNSNNIVFNNSINNLSTKSFNISNVASTSNSINNLSNMPTIISTNNNTQISSKSFATTIYRKPTYTGLITKWSSFVPHTYKVSTISSMVYRAIRICSSYDLMHEQFEFIEFIGIENGYPEGFIKAQIRKTLGRYFDKINGTQIYKSKNKTNNDKDNSIKREQVFIDIPFFGKPTEILGKRIINLAKSINPQLHIQPVQRPSSSITKYFPTKDPIPKLLRSNIVYKLDCSNCESTYIGKTIRQT